ncbi:MAG TPA: FecR domain-containing protein [Roseiarcus sp.]|nr:FecR domain-containing protein [Roseiarcus sp.]
MRTSGQKSRRKRIAANLLAMIVVGLVESTEARAAGACALIPNISDPSVKVLKCGDALTVRPAHGTHYRPVFSAGQALPAAIRLDDGALLIDFHPAAPSDLQILTPLAIAGVRGTKWAMEVNSTRTSTLVLEGAVAVTNRRLNEYVVLTAGQGVDVTASDTTMVQKQWGQARVRALLSRFGE